MVVLAAGISTPALAAKVGVTVPLEDKPGTVNILTAPLRALLRHILVTGVCSASPDHNLFAFVCLFVCLLRLLEFAAQRKNRWVSYP